MEALLESRAHSLRRDRARRARRGAARGRREEETIGANFIIDRLKNLKDLPKLKSPMSATPVLKPVLKSGLFLAGGAATCAASLGALGEQTTSSHSDQKRRAVGMTHILLA